MFREHVALGAIISMIVVVGVYFYALLTDPLLLMFLFGVTVIGSFLPDVDSDSGMPFYLVFGTMTLAATGVVMLYTLNSTYAADWRYLTGIPAAALFVFWFVVGGVVKRCTHHRGIFHSLPALAIAGLGSFLVARYYGLDDTAAWIFGGAMAIGYLSHLVLDEVHAGITLDGIPFNPKSSFGSALKLFSRSSTVNIATYLILALLAYSAFTTPALAFYSSDLDSAQLCCDESSPFQNSAPGGRSYSSKSAMVTDPAPQASGRFAFYNDSEVIELEGAAPPPPPEEDPGSGGGQGDGNGGANGTGSTGSSGSGGGSTGGGGSGGGGIGAGGGAGSGSGNGETLLDELISSGAIEGIDGDDAGGFASGAVTVIGDKVREVFRGRSDLRDVLEAWKSLRAPRGAKGDYGLVAASTALADGNLQEVSFSASAFEIKYRSRGYMLGIFPWSFPVIVTVTPQAPDGGKVAIKLPWYRFFVREFFTPARLAAEIEDAMEAAVAEATPPPTDQNILLFDTVAGMLRQKIGTIADSVTLGE